MATICDKMGHWPSVPFRHDGEDWFAFCVVTPTQSRSYLPLLDCCVGRKHRRNEAELVAFDHTDL